jgi:hypothetical protein
MDTRYANTIINVARGEAIPPPYGKVNDFLTEPGGDPKVRYGWKRLKEYFEVAARYNDGHWRIPGYLDGVKLKNKRIPQPGQSGIQWCGIFATWVWIKAGVPGVYWASPGIKGPDVKIIAGFKGIGLGDIGVQTGGLVHHFIISKINGPPDKPGTTVETINGNSTYQGITTYTETALGVQLLLHARQRVLWRSTEDVWGVGAVQERELYPLWRDFTSVLTLPPPCLVQGRLLSLDRAAAPLPVPSLERPFSGPQTQ